MEQLTTHRWSSGTKSNHDRGPVGRPGDKTVHGIRNSIVIKEKTKVRRSENKNSWNVINNDISDFLFCLH